MPDAPFVASPDQAPSGPTAAVVEGQTVTATTMAPNRLLIPSLGVYAVTDETVMANGELVINDNPAVVDRWAKSAPIIGTEGTVLMAGHVSVSGVRGALYPLVQVKPGALAYTTDSSGKVSAWQAESISAYVKADLPAWVWSATGKRQLVLVTCSGPVLSRTDADGKTHRSHRDNAVAVFVPARNT